MLTDERGFTLIEAMVAMMVCTIGLVAMAELMAVTLRLQQLGRFAGERVSSHRVTVGRRAP